MLLDKNLLIQLTLESGADAAAVADVAEIPFRREFRAACEQNACGKYGRCWMCPPDVGDIDELIAQAKSYRHALVYQSVGQLEDSFDIEGMEAAGHAHNQLSGKLDGQIRPLLGHFLRLAAGACQVCERCAKADALPCRYPDQAASSLESYGIAVSELAALCGMHYINGTNTVTYFGAFLYGDGPLTGKELQL